ncbi:MAG: ABC transporter permease [Burkholderiales bacterium]|nr:ABC transporter permease [Burkholderiales bacterium]
MKILFEIRPIFSALLRNKTAPLLVAIQVALSLAILVNAIYIVNLRLDVAARPSGVENELDVFRVHIANQKLGGHEEQMAMQKQEAATIRAVSGVTSVARTNSMPISYSGSHSGVSIDRKQTSQSTTSGIYVSPDSLVKTWGLKLIQGRDFQAGDYIETDPNTSKEFVKTVIVSKALAGKLFPGQSNFVGREFFFGSGDSANEVRIVGVVETLQTSNGNAEARGAYATLLPARLSNVSYDHYAVRAEPGQRDRVMQEVEAALRKASPTPVKVSMDTMEEFRTNRYRAEKGLAWMLLAVSALLIVVTASGIVGMSSLWVAQRTKQIGVRRALGARKVDILAYFITENLLISGVGIVAGSVLALGLNQLLVSQFELSKLPLLYLLCAPLAFGLLGVAAVYVPAWRAAAISPATATRSA